ncbi:MAG: hypothetical protein M0P71_00875 [Melioribacteraceae bacterium]|nr:hypothetical protein [Melioribacteraceae bacterium]
MNKATEVKKQILKYYKYGFKFGDLSKYMKNNEIDHNIKSLHKHSGFDSPNQSDLAVFYYSDGSMLVISCNNVYSSM